MTTFSSLDTLIHSKTLLKHPFYVRWSKGELTLDELRTYAREYYHLVRHVPGIVARVAERVQDAQMRANVAQNIAEETEHIGLWERFAQSLDIAITELRAYEPSATVKAAVADLEELAGSSLEEGIACMYALEVELPQIAATKKQGLTDFYDLTSQDAHCYFDEHLGEEKHLEVWRAFTLSLSKAKLSAERSCAAQHRVLDAVCEQSGIAMAAC